MQTVELDIDTIKSPKELIQFLKDTHFGVGDNLHLKVEEKQVLFILVIFFIAFGSIIKRQKQGEDILNGLLSKYDNAEELEKDIEKEYGINIELETKNPLKDAFGLWKDYNIDAETLRKEAWQRKG